MYMGRLYGHVFTLPPYTLLFEMPSRADKDAMEQIDTAVGF